MVTTHPDTNELDFLLDFLNSVDDDGLDEFRSPETLSAWLEAHGQPVHTGMLSDDDAHRARRVRAAVRDLIGSAGGKAMDERTLQQLNAISDAAPLRVVVGPSRSVALEPAVEGIDAVFARLLRTLQSAAMLNAFERLKICNACPWAYYDQSKNRSRVWCDMSSCGSRHKVRAFRERERAAKQRSHGDGAG